MKRLLLVVMCTLLVAGCCTANPAWLRPFWCPKETPAATPTPDLAAAGKAVEGSAAVITDETGKAVTRIDKASGGVKESLTTAAEPAKTILHAEVLPNLDAAKTSCLTAQAESKKLTTTTVPQIAAADKAVVQLAAERDAAREAQVKAEKERDDIKANAFRNFLLWVQIAGFGIFVAAIPVFIWLDRTAGISVAAGGLIVLGLAFFVNTYLVWIAWGTAALVAGILAYLGLKAWKESKTSQLAVASGDAGKAEQEAVVDAYAEELKKAGIVVEDFKAALRRAWNLAAMKVQTAANAINQLRDAK